VTVKHRCCNGQCAYETFRLEKCVPPDQPPAKQGLYFEFVKTAFRPYDIAVTAVLLIAKRHLKNQLIIYTNGLDAQWADARRICQRVLGFGDWFGIVEDKEEGRTLVEVVP
jgi:hypothetical protein